MVHLFGNIAGLLPLKSRKGEEKVTFMESRCLAPTSVPKQGKKKMTVLGASLPLSGRKPLTPLTNIPNKPIRGDTCYGIGAGYGRGLPFVACFLQWLEVTRASDPCVPLRSYVFLIL